MDILEALSSRKSIRKYTDQPISKEMIQDLLRAAMSAPSAYNQQSWQFVVIQEKEILQKMAQISPKASMCVKAPLGILVCGDLGAAEAPSFWMQDCSAATQNILIAAHAKGLGSVWTAVYPIEDVMGGVRTLLQLPASIIPFSFVVLGYPFEKTLKDAHFHKERIHENQW
ncbi:MAG: nitroreductase family protein [Chlamydiota bacterium]